MLDQRSIATYLVNRQLITERSIVDGNLVIRDESRRNRIYVVTCSQGPGYLVKLGTQPSGIGSISHEAAVYRSLQSPRSVGGLTSYLPHSYGYDDAERVLMLELVADAHDLHTYHAQLGRFPVTVARQLGDVLGLLHTRVRVANDMRSWAGGQPPWVLNLHRPTPSILRHVSAANIQLIKALQLSSELCQRLDELRDGWQASALLHYDVKWENCLVHPLNNTTRVRGLKLVDWELAQMGDPCWDVGSAFAAYLDFWLFSIPVIGDTPMERSLDLAQYQLTSMQPAMRAFWHSYIQRVRPGPDIAARCLRRSVRYAAARLIQIGYEQMQHSATTNDLIVMLLQLSLNMLRRPEEAIVHLLGLALSSTDTI